MSDVREQQSAAKRIVVKVGSSTLTTEGKLRPRKFGELAASISRLMDAGREVVVVSSGAIAVGSHRLGWNGPGPAGVLPPAARAATLPSSCETKPSTHAAAARS